MIDSSVKENSQINARFLRDINSEFKVTEANGFGSLVNYSSLSDEPVHRWFRYREGYSIQLVKKLIKDLPKGSIIVDPFCGCGTSLIAAQDLGFESYGFDINPISTLVSRVKTREYLEDDLERLESIKDNIRFISNQDPEDNPPVLSIIDKVFHPSILSSLLRMRRYFKTIEEEHIRDFLMVAWLSILEEVSNVYKEGNGIKYRNRKRLPTGYITIQDSEWQIRLFPEDKFEFSKNRVVEKISLMIRDARNRNKKLPKAHVIEASAEKADEYINENSAAYIVFSPPYCNCFNYFKIFKIELWMGEFVKTYKELQMLNRRAMRSHVETKMVRDYDKPITYVDKYVELIDKDKLWDRRIPKAIQGYFIDMKRILKTLHKILRPDGKCVIVVGNSAYSNILIPTDSLLAKISHDLGFEVEKISVARHLTTSSQQKKNLEDRKEYLRESLVILIKPDKRLEEKKLLYVGELPLDIKDDKEKVFVIKNNGLCNFTHKFHRFPGKFIPHIPRWALVKYLNSEQNRVVLDPFCGSGTTLVESMLFGHNAYGIDIDPIARLVSRAKTTAIDKLLLDECVNNIKKDIKKRKEGGFRPRIDALNHWFTEQAVRELSIIRDSIEEYKSQPKLYDFLMVCFLSTIRRASNADNQTQKTYVSHTYKKSPESAKLLFLKALENYSGRLKGFMDSLPNNAQSFLLEINDARNFVSYWANQGLPKVDLAITSPPYVKSVDYVYNQMAEYFWIGDLFNMENQPKQNEHKKNYIGTTKIFKADYSEYHKIGIPSIDKLSYRIYKKNPKYAFVVYKYFSDLIKHFVEMKKVLSDDAHYLMVVGDSLVSNEPVIVHELVQDCALDIGFKVEGIFGYEIRNRHMRFPRRGRGGIVRYDWAIDFKQKG